MSMDAKRIENMKIGGRILGEVLSELIKFVAPGVSEIELDSLAEKLILKKGGKVGFKKVPGYKHTICVSTNDVVVHGIPTDRKLATGDIIGIDCGVFFEGFHTDMAETLCVSTVDNQQLTIDQKKVERFLEAGKKALFAGIKEARVGNRVGHISRAIQAIIEGAGYSVVRNLVGHGVGKALHEDPEIPGYLSQKIDLTPALFNGQTLAIEAIYNMGNHEVVYDRNDDWTIRTRDGSLSGLFERTILITEEGLPEILSRLSDDPIRYKII